MPKSLFNVAPLLDAISGNALILTPNSRQRNKLIDAYNLHQSNHCNESAWLSPRVFSLSQWSAETYQQLLDFGALDKPRALLSDFAERQLWQQIIERDSVGAEMINPVKLASDAQSAYNNLLRWNLKPETLETEEDSVLLLKWCTEFEQQMDRLRLLNSNHAMQHVIGAYEAGKLPREKTLLLVGFDDIPPLTQSLFDSVSQNPQTVSVATLKSATCEVNPCLSNEEEMRQAASWAFSQLQQDPEASIGIISPDLGQQRQQIERIFVETFEAHYPLPETSRYTLPFNFSAGTPLGNTALIHDTLQLLRLNLYRSPVEQLDNLLFSPFWEITDSQAIQLSASLADVFRESLKTSRVRQLVHQHTSKAPDDHQGDWQALDDRLQDFESLRRQSPAKQAASRWIELFERQLRRLGWPGSRRLDSNEFQQMNQWYELLESFSAVDQLGIAMSCAEAIDQLAQLASGVHFQPQTPESPIQILGMLEGSGLQFTHCWVMGLSQQNWPPSPEPNPLIPLHIQREHKMPHADAERELLYAERLTKGYAACAPEVVFSFPQNEDGNPLQKSPLLNEFELRPDTFDFKTESGWQDYQASLNSDLDWVNTGTAPRVEEQELGQLLGGSQIFKNQAVCPFAAFAMHRLGARTRIPRSAGFTAIQRGEILHDALSDIWEALKSQTQLISTPDPELRTMIRENVTRHVDHFARREPDVYGTNYTELEIGRQSNLIYRWLQLEIERESFEVAANEEAIQVEFAGLPLTLRLDRMDKLNSGELVLIDYKTGTPAIKNWGGERPEEPQLPLYCLCFEQSINAVVFAQINTKEIVMKGLGQLSSVLDGVQDASKGESIDLPGDWESIQAHWREQLERLGQEFIQGDCSPEFKSPALKRFYSDLAPILRWQEENDIRQAYEELGSSGVKQ